MNHSEILRCAAARADQIGAELRLRDPGLPPDGTADLIQGGRFRALRRAEPLSATPALGVTYLVEDYADRAYEALKLFHHDFEQAASQVISAQIELADITGVDHVDAGVDGPLAWTARTWVESSLLELIDEDELEPGRPTMELLGNLASVLEAAHAEGYVHGRLHPRQILIETVRPFTEREQVQTFAYMVDWLGFAPKGPTAAVLVRHHRGVAPEVAAGEPPSRSADTWSLANIAWLMIFGQAPSLRDLFVGLDHPRNRPERVLAEALLMRPNQRPAVRTLVEEVAEAVLGQEGRPW